MANTTRSGREKQRSRTGCRTCRSRKVKCDERPGGCHNCARLNLPCPNSPAFHDAIRQGENESNFLRTQAGLRRSRTYRSCRACRSSKSRCSGERPACLRCRDRGIDCRYDGKQAPAWMEAASQDLDGTSLAMGEAPSISGADRSQPSSPGLSHADSNLSSRGGPTTSEPETGQQPWLFATELPKETDRVLELVEAFFVNMHSLRSFGFIHKPSVMQNLENWSSSWYQHQRNALVLIVCALGAKFCASRYYDDAELAGGLGLAAGTQWAREAQQLLISGLTSASVESCMAVVLLHEHELRVGNRANAFMLTGLGVRMAQALRINIESPSDVSGAGPQNPSATTKEAKRRLMWSIYIMDSWVGSGVDELTLINEADVRIQLPCSDQSFESQQSCIVEALQPGTYLPFISAEDRLQGSVQELDLQGHFIRLVSLRRKVLRFVKSLDQAQPWLPMSEIATLQRQLRHWKSCLPETLRFTRKAVHVRHEMSQLGGLLLCHITYHQTMSDLLYIALHDVFGINGRAEDPPEQRLFLKRAQDQCFEQSIMLCALFEEATRHGQETLVDTWLSVVAHESAKVIIRYVSKGFGSSKEKGEAVRARAVAAVHANIRALESMIPLHSLARCLHSAVIRMLVEEGYPVPSSSSRRPSPFIILESEEAQMDSGSAAQGTSDILLNPPSTFRMARNDICEGEKHSADAAGYRSTTTVSHQPSPRVGQISRSTPAPVSCTMPTASAFELAPVTVPSLPSYATPASSSPSASTMFLDDSLGLNNIAMNSFDVAPTSQTHLSSSFGGLQNYLPLMANDMGMATALSDFTNVSAYPPPPSMPTSAVSGDFVGSPVSFFNHQVYPDNSGHIMNWDV